jgi:hypothetical protein
MQRFQRAKLERQVADVRRELWGWVAIYRTMISPENQMRYDDRQLQIAEDRALYLEHLAVTAERLEELLMKAAMP